MISALPYPMFATFFICFFLGGVWGVTSSILLGFLAILIFFSLFFTGTPFSLVWVSLGSINLLFCLYWVGRVAGARVRNGRFEKRKRVRPDQILAVLSFAAGYVGAWIGLWELVNALLL